MIVLLVMPTAVLITAVLRREPMYQGKPAAVWVREIRTNQDAALKAIQQLGLDAIPALNEMLHDNSPTESCRAAWAMGRLGPEAARAAVPDLIERMDSGGVGFQTEVLHSLSRIGITNQDIVPKLLAKLSQDYISSFATELLLSIEKERAKNHLPPITGDEFAYDVAFARSPTMGVRICGAYKLSMLAKSDERAKAALESLLDDKEIAVRAEAGRLIKTPASVPDNFRLVVE